LSSFGYLATQVEEDLNILKFDLRTGRARKIAPFKEKDSSITSKISKSLNHIIQANLDQISKDSVTSTQDHIQASINYEWAYKTRALMGTSTPMEENLQFPGSRSLLKKEPLAFSKKSLPKSDFKPAIIPNISAATLVIPPMILNKYAQVINNYIEYKHIRKYADNFSFAGQVKDILYNEIGSTDNSNLIWDLFLCQLNENELTPIKQEEYLKKYVTKDPEFMGMLIKKSGAYLENAFLRNLQNQGAEAGKSEQNILYLIENYLKSMFGTGLKEFAMKNPGLKVSDDGLPIFVIMYYLIHAGLYKDAIDYANQSQVKSAIELSKFIEVYLENDLVLLGKSLDSALIALDKKISETDYYEKAIYIILTKHHIEPNPMLLSYLEDYIWFYLKICHTRNNEELYREMNVAYKTLTLSEFQENILNFNKEQQNVQGDDPLLRFKTLALVGLYPEAIEYLKDFPNYFIHCVHFGIFLNEAGLLPSLTLLKKYSIEESYLEDLIVFL